MAHKENRSQNLISDSYDWSSPELFKNAIQFFKNWIITDLLYHV